MGRAYNSLRVTVTTVLACAGLLDIATEAGVTRYKQDFGLTLACWHVPSGPYFVIPFARPACDGVGLVADWTASPVTREIHHVLTRNSLYALWAVDKRAAAAGRRNARIHGAGQHSFTRDAYLQLRAVQAMKCPMATKAMPGRLPREDEQAPHRCQAVCAWQLQAPLCFLCCSCSPCFLRLSESRVELPPIKPTKVAALAVALRHHWPDAYADEAPDRLIQRLSDESLQALRNDSRASWRRGANRRAGGQAGDAARQSAA